MIFPSVLAKSAESVLSDDSQQAIFELRNLAKAHVGTALKWAITTYKRGGGSPRLAARARARTLASRAS